MDPFRVQHLLPKLRGHTGKMVQEDAGMKRMVRPAYNRYTDPPKFIALPFTICFNFQGTSLTHAEVKASIESKLEQLSGQYAITCVQFQSLASHLNIKAMDNRWVVSFNKNEPKLELVRFGLKLRGSYVTVRDYSDVQRVEMALWQLVNPDKAENLLGTDGSRPTTGFDTSLTGAGAGNSEFDKIKRALMKRRPTFAELRALLDEA